jgi:hypothetical protein
VNAVSAQPSDWAVDSVKFMEENALTENSFPGGYQDTMTRAEFACVMVNAFERAYGGELTASAPFEDVDGPYADKIKKAYAAGFISGVSSTRFAPYSPLTREQAAVILMNFVKFAGVPYAYTNNSLNFNDASRVSKWAERAVALCVENGFMSGVSVSEFAPDVSLTREQGLTLSYNILTKRTAANVAESGNFARGSDFAVMGGKAYFIAVENGESFLYSLSSDGAEKIVKAYGLAAKDGYIYTILSENGVHGDLIRIDAATGAFLALEKIRGASAFIVDSGYIYFTNYMSPITRMKTDGSEKTAIQGTENALDLFVTDKTLYFTTQSALKQTPLLESGAARTICPISDVTDFIVSGDNVYMLVLNKNEERKSETPTDLYMATPQNVIKIAERIGFIYSCARGVYAYAGEPLDSNAVYRVNGGSLEPLNSPSLKILVSNNASNLYFTDDGKLYYSVYKPNAQSEFFDYQRYMHTNVIDLKTAKTTAFDGGPMYIHCAAEAAYAAPEMRYRVSSLAEVKEVAVIKTAESVLAQIIRPEMSELQKAKAIHDYIILNCVYDVSSVDTAGEYFFTYRFYTNRFNPQYFYINMFDDVHMPYGALVNGLAMCGGYSEAAWLLFSMSGLEAHVMSGVAWQEGYTPERHKWNLVKIDGKYGYVDVTWDDPVPDRPGLAGDLFFNVDGEFMASSHTLDDESKRLADSLS